MNSKLRLQRPKNISAFHLSNNVSLKSKKKINTFHAGKIVQSKTFSGCRMCKSTTIKSSRSKIQSHFTQMFDNRKVMTLYDTVQAKNFQFLINNFTKIKSSKNFDQSLTFSSNLENAFNLIRLGMPDSLQKAKIEDYQRELFELRKITNQLKSDKDNAGLYAQFESRIDIIIRKFESRKRLTEFFNEFGTNEDEVEKDMQKHLRII